MVLWRIILR
jgi:hypothetical protein